MKIALSGAHSVGKSTLVNELCKHFPFSKLEHLPEITRTLHEKGFSINEAGTDITQHFIMSTHMDNLFYKQDFIVDRCLLDGYVYTKVLGNRIRVSRSVVDYAAYLYREYIINYDYIFYIPADIPVEDDGVRSTDKLFRDQVIHEFEVEKNRLLVEKRANIFTLTGSVEERVDLALKILQENGYDYERLL